MSYEFSVLFWILMNFRYTFHVDLFVRFLFCSFLAKKNSSCGNFFHKSTSHNSKMTLPAFALQKKMSTTTTSLLFYSWLVAGNFQIKPKWQMADQLPVFSTQKYEIPSPRRNATALTFLVGKNSAFGIPMPCLQNCFFKVVKLLKIVKKNVVLKYRRLSI